jgi:hypothetical protein
MYVIVNYYSDYVIPEKQHELFTIEKSPPKLQPGLTITRTRRSAPFC